MIIHLCVDHCDKLALPKGKNDDLGLKHTKRDTSSQTIAPGTLSTDLILKYAVQPYFMITTAEPHERQSISQGQIGAYGTLTNTGFDQANWMTVPLRLEDVTSTR
jgi:hypothetical protein